MSDFGFEFDPSTTPEPEAMSDVVPAGVYNFLVEERRSVAFTRSGDMIKDPTSQQQADAESVKLSYQCRVQGPKYVNRVVFCEFTTKSDSDTKQAKSRALLGAMFRACGITTRPESSRQVLGKQFSAELTVSDATEKYKARNWFQKFAPFDPKLSHTSSAATTTATPAVSLDAKPPWA